MVKQKISDIRNKIIPKRRNIKSRTSSNFEDSNKIMKLFLLIVIVNKGQGEAIQNILSKNKVSASFAFHGVGTASKETYLNDLFEDKKTIVMGIISQDDYDKVKNDLIDRFKISRYAKGIFFTIDLSSMAGVSLYKYFTKMGFMKEKEFD